MPSSIGLKMMNVLGRSSPNGGAHDEIRPTGVVQTERMSNLVRDETLQPCESWVVPRERPDPDFAVGGTDPGATPRRFPPLSPGFTMVLGGGDVLDDDPPVLTRTVPTSGMHAPSVRLPR